MGLGSPCRVSASKSCRWQVFASGVRQSASFEVRLCLTHKTTHDADWREAEPATTESKRYFASRKAPWGFHLFLPFGRSSLLLHLQPNRKGNEKDTRRLAYVFFVGLIVQKCNLHYSTSYHSSPISKYLTGSFVMKKKPS